MAGSANNFTFTITALDKATATLRAVKNEIRSAYMAQTAPVRALTSSLSALSAETGLTSVARGAEHAAASIFRLGRGVVSGLLAPLGRLVGLGGGLGAIFGVGAVAGLIEIAKGGAEGLAALGEASEKTGVNVTALARLHYAAKQTHVETDLLDKSLFRLNVRLDQAKRGKNKDVAGLFSHYFGPKWKSQFTDAYAGLAKISDLVAKTPTARRADIVASLFGARGGGDLLPLLARGSAALRAFAQEFVRLHGDVTPAQVLIGEQAVEAWRKLDTATSGLKDAIGVALAPTITSLLTPMTDWIAQNRELIGQDVGKWAKELGTYLKNIDWKRVGKDALDMVHDAQTLMRGLVLIARDIRAVYEFVHPTMTTISDADRSAMLAAMKKQGLTEATPEWTANFFRQRAANARTDGRSSATTQRPVRRSNDSSLGGYRPLSQMSLQQPLIQPAQDLQRILLKGINESVHGRVEVNITANNMPPGTKVRATSSGQVNHSLEVGKSNPSAWRSQ